MTRAHAVIISKIMLSVPLLLLLLLSLSLLL